MVAQQPFERRRTDSHDGHRLGLVVSEAHLRHLPHTLQQQVGLGAGLGLAFMRSGLTRTVFETQDARHVVPTPFLGQIPYLAPHLSDDPRALGVQEECVRMVRTALLDSLLLAGFTPVIAPVAPPAEGEAGAVPLNVNADFAAAAVAGALRAAELLFVSDVPGVEVDGVAQPAIALAEIDGLIARGVATSGMATKLRAAARGLKHGARAVRIGDLRMLTDATAGTRLLSSASHQPA